MHMDENMTYPIPRIKEVRAEQGVSQIELARRLGVPQQNISRLERGVTELTPSWATKIGDALGITPALLFAETMPEEWHELIAQVEDFSPEAKAEFFKIAAAIIALHSPVLRDE